MKHVMFCYQCQETKDNCGCTLSGVCGKKPEVSHLMDQLIRQLKILALSRQADRKNGRFAVQSLFMTITNTNFDPERLKEQLMKARKLTGDTAIDLPSDIDNLIDADAISLRELLLYALKGIAAYTEHAAILGKEEPEIYQFIFEALAIAAREKELSILTAAVLKAGTFAVKAMELLDNANTAEFGDPQFTEVTTLAGRRPGILVSGHDLMDLHELLIQTVDQDIDIYTHGEMLPAHAYPGLKKFPHLHGNYGSSWYQQAKDFTTFNGPILMTTNCIIPVQKNYADRIFTTGMAGYPGVKHIIKKNNGRAKDFSGLIALAHTLPPPEKNHCGTLITGFARKQLLDLSGKIARAITRGVVKRLIVMAGCDGRQSCRSYYTEVARNLPDDTIILTAGCAKYRFNHLEPGNIDGIPRILDAGQCNDSYSLVVFLLELKKLLNAATVDKLPVSLDIAWYEQKAVAVLTALLACGFKNIRLGPTLPAFLSPAVIQTLEKNFGIKAIGRVNEDIREMMLGL